MKPASTVLGASETDVCESLACAWNRTLFGGVESTVSIMKRAVLVLISALALGACSSGPMPSNDGKAATDAVGPSAATVAPEADTPHGLVGPGEPCSMAVHAARIQDLRTSTTIWPASDEEPTDAWTCGGTPVLLYDDVQVSYEGGWGAVDVPAKWASMVESSGGSVQTILGRPAYVHPADATGPRNGVMIVVGDQLVRLIAKPEVAIQRLVDLASTLDLPEVAP